MNQQPMTAGGQPVPASSVNLPVPYEMRAFKDIPVDDDFISPEGSWCRKLGMASARMMDQDDGAYSVGDIVPFRKSEVVEYVPRFAPAKA